MSVKFALRVLLLLVLLSSKGYTQLIDLKEVKEYYKNQDAEQPLTLCLDTDSEIPQIVLIRHGEPDIKKKGWRNRDEAILYMQAYDSAIVKPFKKGPLNPDSIPIDTILHSSLPRAKNTAQLAFGETKILAEDSNYREFERKAMKWPNMKMPTGFWTTGSRILWLMGLNDKNIETSKQAKGRAKKNAGILAKQAERDGIVILVAHGLHNKYLKKYLRKYGWKVVFNNGNDYLSVKILAWELKPKKTKRKRTIYDPCDC